MIRPDESPGNGSAVPGQRNGASAKGRLEKRLPLSQRVVDQVKDLPAEQQREVWKEAVKTAPNGRVTAAHIKKVKDAVTPKEPDKRSGRRG
jgi:hypothetical protein